MEQEYIFPVLGERNVRVRRALVNHRRLNRLFNQEFGIYRILNLIEEELGQFTWYEERILYNEIESVVSAQRLAEIEKRHQSAQFSDDDWEDQFWKSWSVISAEAEEKVIYFFEGILSQYFQCKIQNN